MREGYSIVVHDFVHQNKLVYKKCRDYELCNKLECMDQDLENSAHPLVYFRGAIGGTCQGCDVLKNRAMFYQKKQ